MRGRLPAAQAGRSVAGYAQREIERRGRQADGLPAAQALTGPSLGKRLGTYVVPQAPSGGGDAESRASLVGTLARFVAYLKKNAIPDDVEGPDVHHKLHRYAYIAKGLGMRLEYDFDFLEIGAFSPDMEADLFRMGTARGGAEPFAGDAGASEAFLGLVRDREAEWLQLATFAVRERGADGALERFAKRPRGAITYDRGMAEDAFAAVARCAGRIAGNAP